MKKNILIVFVISIVLAFFKSLSFPHFSIAYLVGATIGYFLTLLIIYLLIVGIIKLTKRK